MPALSVQSQTDKCTVNGADNKFLCCFLASCRAERKSRLLHGTSTWVIRLLYVVQYYTRYGHGLDHLASFLRSCQNSFFRSEWKLVNVRRPNAQVFNFLNFWTFSWIFSKHGQICSHEHWYLEVESKLFVDLWYNDNLGTLKWFFLIFLGSLTPSCSSNLICTISIRPVWFVLYSLKIHFLAVEIRKTPFIHLT